MNKRIKIVDDCTNRSTFTIDELEKIDNGDIELVRSQTNSSYKEAILALLRCKGDIVDAIMELTENYPTKQ